MKTSRKLSVLAVVGLSCWNLQASIVSLWDFYQPTGADPDHNWQSPVVDQRGRNDGWISGTQITSGTYEGYGAMGTLGNAWDCFYAPTTGLSTTAGTYMFAYKTNGYGRAGRTSVRHSIGLRVGV